MDAKGSYINFEKEEYTLPETIELVAECYDISIRETNNKTKRKIKNQDYFTIYHFLKKELDDAAIDEMGDELEPKDSTGRKTKYPVKLVRRVVNEKLGPYFSNFASKERQKALEKYEEQAKTWVQEFADGTYGDFEAELNEYREEMRSPEHEAEHYIEAMFQRYKFDLLMDIVFNHLIFLDEKKLKADLSIALTFGDNDPDAKDMEAID